MDNIKLFLEDPIKFANTASVDNLADMLRYLSRQYYNTDSPLVSDQLFDELRDILESRDLHNPYFKEIGAPIDGDKVKLPYYMGSLDKFKPNNVHELSKWLLKYKGPYVVSDKLDGISALLTGNKKLYTRGNGTFGQDISHLIPYVLWRNANIPNNYAIRGELVMSKSNFEKVKDQFKNPRAAVAGIVNTKKINTNNAKLVHFVAYNLIFPEKDINEQFKLIQQTKCPLVTYIKSNKIDMQQLSEYYMSRREKSIYDIDGLVISDSSKIHKLISGQNPDYAFAFKMRLDEQLAQTEVLKVEWNISKDGYLKPRIIVVPIIINGVQIKYATAFNALFVKDNNLGPGAIIKLARSGDVIPDIQEVIKCAKEPQMPDVPYIWTESGVDIIASDIHGSLLNVVNSKQILYFFKTLGVKFISIGIITKLVENGYDNVIKILKADVKELEKINGIGDKTITKIYDNIVTTLETTNLSTLMAASGVFGRGISDKKLKMVIDTYPNIMNICFNEKKFYNELLEIKGFEDKTAMKISTNFKNFIEFFNDLDAIGKYSIGHLKIPKNISRSNLLNGKIFVFTGFRNDEWKKIITSNGGTISDSVSKKTSTLIFKDKDSEKYKKAVSLGVDTMTMEDFEIKVIKPLQ